jgi:uncharacterized protein (TIGR03435 family)
MLQALLGERFGLAVRWVAREENIYALVRARDDGSLGPQLRPSTLDCAVRRVNVTPPVNVASQERDEPLFCTIAWNEEKFRARGHRMSEIASYFSIVMQRPVLDRTELDGLFDLEMTASQEGTPALSFLRPRPDSVSSNAPAFLTALREQAGLTLQSQRDSVPALVIEQVGPPTEN